MAVYEKAFDTSSEFRRVNAKCGPRDFFATELQKREGTPRRYSLLESRKNTQLNTACCNAQATSRRLPKVRTHAVLIEPGAPVCFSGNREHMNTRPRFGPFGRARYPKPGRRGHTAFD